MGTIYLTYEQWSRLGYQVKKGEKATRFGGLTVEPSLKFSEHQVKPKQHSLKD
jgi:antirestriction protein ArdC